jgi:HAD superfamily hydrolase (TIGR01509 family)
MNNSKEIEAVIFDMDGVLIDSHPAHRASWREFLHSVGKDVSEAQLDFILDGHTREEILRHFLGALSAAEMLAYGRRKDEFFRILEHGIEPVEGVIAFVKRLSSSDVECAIATSASEIRTFATIERLGIAEHFAAVVTASDVTAGKPDPLVYQLACDRLNLSPQAAIAFDDAPSGVQSARSAGMRCIGVSSNGLQQQLLRAGAEHVIPNFLGLTLPAFARAA